MRDAHEPRREFVEQLEGQIALEARRRNREARALPWAPWSRLKMGLVAASLALVSMATGAAVVAAAYEAQGSAKRDQLAQIYASRLDVATRKLALTEESLHGIERQVSVGAAPKSALLEEQLKVAEAQAQLMSLRSQLEEVRLTGVDPRTELSAPKVSGRDFVGERLRTDMAVPETALQLEEERLRDAQRRFSVGVTDATEMEAARMRVTEVQDAVQTFRQKIDIRQRFLTGVIDAVETELRGLEAEADQRHKTTQAKLALAQMQEAQAQKRMEVGTGERVAVAQAQLNRMQLQTDLMKAELDLTAVRKQIEQHKTGK